MPIFRQTGYLLRPFVAAVTTFALCLVILTAVLHLPDADLRVPFLYQKDGLFTQLWIKTLVENGWYLHNDRLGAPGGLDLHDFPMADNLHFLLIKLAALATSDFVLLYNLYFLATFPLAALTSLFVLRRLGLSYGPAIVASLLFAFSPYHFFRGQGHLFLSAYFLVPLAVLVLVWVSSERPCFFAWDESHKTFARRLLSRRSFAGVAVAALLGAGGVYYAYFACCLLGVTGLAASWRCRRPQPLVAAGMLIVVTSTSVFLNLTPNLLYRICHGTNPDAVVRQVGAAEVYGLKVAQLLLPTEDHRLAPLAGLRTYYTSTRLPLASTSEKTPLGAIAGLGFLLLLGRLLAMWPRRRPGLLDTFGTLNGAALLLGLMGGFGALVALALPWIRCYERIAVYIAFWSTAAVFLLLDRLARRYAGGPVARWAFHGLLAGLLALGVADQTMQHAGKGFSAVAAAYQSDADFVGRIEAAMPAGALIFQLPYMPFPEYGRLHRMGDYDHLRGYLHSRTLRWSYGAVKGREGDAMLRTLAEKPAEQLLESLALAGYSGVYLDRFGFADFGVRTEADLRRLANSVPLVSSDQRLEFFDLTRYAERLRSHYTDAAWQVARDVVLHPLTVAWRGGFSVPEGTPENSWRWCAAEGDLEVTNPASQSRRAVLRMSCSTGRSEPATLRMDGPDLSRRWDVSIRSKHILQRVTIPPGRHVIHFSCDAARTVVPNDTRELVFRVENLVLQPED
jgi:phosphoglycerol transferase